MKSENEALRLELEEKYKALEKSLDENAALKLTINEKKKHTYHKHANRPPRKKHAHITFYECGRKGHIAFHCSLFIILLKINVLHLRRFGFLKVPMS